jgi:hypothetical protein
MNVFSIEIFLCIHLLYIQIFDTVHTRRKYFLRYATLCVIRVSVHYSLMEWQYRKIFVVVEKVRYSEH